MFEGYDFGQLAEADLDPSQAADLMISEIKSAYRAGGLKINLTPDNIARILSGGIFGTTSQQAAINKNYADISKYIDKWSTIYRQWAENGKRDDGTSYNWTRWLEFGNDLAGSIKAQTGYAWDGSVIVNAGRALGQTASDMNKIVNPFQWPSWVLPLGIGLAGLVLYFKFRK